MTVNNGVLTVNDEGIVDEADHLVKTSAGYDIYSPDKSVKFALSNSSKLTYSVERTLGDDTVTWVRPSDMGVTVGGVAYGTGATVENAAVEYIAEDRALMGNQSVVEGRYIAATFNMKKGGVSFVMHINVYNDGVAFNFELPGTTSTSISDNTTYALRTDIGEYWYSIYSGALGTSDYEAIPTGHTPSEKPSSPIYEPLLAIVGDYEGFISIMEGDMTDSYPGTVLKAQGDNTFSTTYMSSTSFPKDTPIVTAWKIINISDTLNGIVNNYNIYTLADLPDESIYGDGEWITPGRSTWSWVAEGYSGARPTVQMMKRYISVATKLGFEYNIIDDGWPDWTDYREGLTYLGSLGELNNVGQILWGAITAGKDGYNKMPTKAKVDEFLDLLEETHMVGAKVDFWWPESNTDTTMLQQYILKEAAKRNMVIDFHGCNKPSGFNITYPNELSREGVHGGEYYNMQSANKPEYATYITAQLFTRYLAGHADWTPGTYNAMEIASALCIDSPLMVYASKPEDMLESPAVSILMSMPSVWDKTVVLSDTIVGKYAVYAKENGGVWYAGAVSAAAMTGTSIKLAEFLPDDGEYEATVFYDDNGTMKGKTLTVTSEDVINIGDLAAGEGWIARFTKLSLSQYGGEITDKPITVTAPAGSVVKYTTDGSDPRTSDTAITYDGGITLNESCRVNFAIVSGEGKGTYMSYQFNIPVSFDPTEYEITYFEDRTELTFSPVTGETIYYTTDGSEPTASSAVYSSKITVYENTVIKALSVRSIGIEVSMTIPLYIKNELKDLGIMHAVAYTEDSFGGDHLKADKLFDGDNETYWQANDTHLKENGSSYAQVEFDGVYSITAFNLRCRDIHANGSGQILVSTDGVNWTTVVTGAGAAPNEDEYYLLEQPVSAKYVRLVVSESSNSKGLGPEVLTLNIYE